MANIAILPDQLANKIAAGEVVQRPESALKELIENALDAGATSVEAAIKRAGKALIQVTDDGEGMSEEDVRLSIQKHATSKVRSLEDLEAITTLGFRGEALSSIAAVSRLEIRSRREEDELGVSLKYDDAEGARIERGAYPKGTTVSARNLFYNTPARRNFLRTDATELKHIVDTFKRTALAKPDTTFRLYVDDRLEFDCPKATLRDRVKQIFGAPTRDALAPFEERTEYVSARGFLGKPTLVKKSRGDQYLYLNGRAVNSKPINHAVFSAYEHLIEKGEYPFFVIFLEMDPRRADVNVHPSKLEVRFDRENDVYEFTRSAARKALAAHDLASNLTFSPTPERPHRTRLDPFTPAEPAPYRSSVSSAPERPKAPRYSDKEIDRLFGSIDAQPGRGDAFSARREEPPRAIGAENREPVEAPPPSDDQPFLAQLHRKYILSQIKSGLMIIDQHVAHERILYEKALRRFETDAPPMQSLLFPKTMRLDAGRYELLEEMKPWLERLGFDIEFRDRNVVTVKGAPDDVREGDEERVMIDMIDEYAANRREGKLEGRDNMAATYSCKAAIKAGDALSDREMRILIDELFATTTPYACPHGRPIVVKLPLTEFDLRFGRTS
jgi:DNA mismatch repair protein MutL